MREFVSEEYRIDGVEIEIEIDEFFEKNFSNMFLTDSILGN